MWATWQLQNPWMPSLATFHMSINRSSTVLCAVNPVFLLIWTASSHHHPSPSTGLPISEIQIFLQCLLSLLTCSHVKPEVTSAATGIPCCSHPASTASHCHHDNPLEAWQEVATWTYLWKASLTVCFSHSFLSVFPLPGFIPYLKLSFKRTSCLLHWRKRVCVRFHFFKHSEASQHVGL